MSSLREKKISFLEKVLSEINNYFSVSASLNKKAMDEPEVLYEDDLGNKIVFDQKNNKIAIWYDGGSASEYPIYYGDGEFGYDHPEAIPEELKRKYQEIVIEREGDMDKNASLNKKADNPTVADVLNIDDEELDQAFISEQDKAVVVNIESNTMDVTENGLAEKISDKVYDLKPQLLEKYPGKNYVEINTFASLYHSAEDFRGNTPQQDRHHDWINSEEYKQKHNKQDSKHYDIAPSNTGDGTKYPSGVNNSFGDSDVDLGNI